MWRWMWHTHKTALGTTSHAQSSTFFAWVDSKLHIHEMRQSSLQFWGGLASGIFARVGNRWTAAFKININQHSTPMSAVSLPLSLSLSLSLSPSLSLSLSLFFSLSLLSELFPTISYKLLIIPLAIWPYSSPAIAVAMVSVVCHAADSCGRPVFLSPAASGDAAVIHSTCFYTVEILICRKKFVNPEDLRSKFTVPIHRQTMKKSCSARPSSLLPCRPNVHSSKGKTANDGHRQTASNKYPLIPGSKITQHLCYKHLTK